MKYGILTFHNVPNYGAVLQAYALCKTVRDLGFDCDIINYVCSAVCEKERKNNSGSLLKYAKSYFFSWQQQKQRIKGHDAFLNHSGLLSDKIYHTSDISTSSEIYDGFIVGSDQVWNTQITRNDYTYFLDFAGIDKKKIAYAASAGLSFDVWFNKLIDEKLKEFDSIGVREEDLSYNLSKRLEKPAVLVCDPTMLLPSSFYSSIGQVPQFDDYVLVYYPSKALIAAATEFAKRYHFKVLVIAYGKKSSEYIKISPNSPIDWLGLIEHAKAVFTNSYHGFLFSLYFHKNVWTEYSGNKSSRQETLINQFGLNKCYLWNDPSLENEINYSKVESGIIDARNRSIDFILSSL